MTEETLKLIISAEIGKLLEELKKGQKEVEKFGSETKKSFSKINDAMQSIGDKSKSALKVMGGAVAGGTTALLGMTAASSDFRKQQGLLISAFEASGGSAKDAKKTYNDLYKVLGDGDKATEAAQHLAKLSASQEELSEWTDICQGVYASFGDSLAIEGLTEAINHTTNLGEVQGTLADALEWSGVSVEDFNAQLAACNSETEREQLIRSTLNGLYSEASTAYANNNAAIIAQNEANLQMQTSMAAIGEALAPVNAMLTELGATVLAQLAPYIQDFSENHMPKVKEILLGVAEAIGKVITWIVDNWELVSTIAIIVAGISAALTVLSTVMGVVNAVMAVSPVTWIILGIVAAVTALAAIIVVCIKYWDQIKEVAVNVINTISDFITDLWDSIVSGLESAWNWVTNLLSTVGTWIYDNVIAPIANFFTGLWDGIVSGFHAVIDPWIEIIKRASTLVYNEIIKPIIDYFAQLWEDIKAIFSTVGSWFNDNVIQPLTKAFSGIWDVIKKGAANAWAGIKSVFSSVATFFKDIFTTAWEAVKKVFSVGGKIFDGIKDGIVTAFKTIVNAIIKGINKVVSIPFNAINTVLNRIRKIDILGVKPFTWVHTFQVPQIPLLERGGVLEKGQIGLLEGNGAEAVVPLEKNTEWLTKIANMLNERMGGNAPIVLQVDGKTFAQISVDSINQLTKQRGSLPLAIV